MRTNNVQWVLTWLLVFQLASLCYSWKWNWSWLVGDETERDFCGLNRNQLKKLPWIGKRIVGGKFSEKAKWPWLVSMQLSPGAPIKPASAAQQWNMKELFEELKQKAKENGYTKQEVKNFKTLLKKMGEIQHRKSYNVGHVCGGTLIKKQWVLTAKHCFGKSMDPSRWKVRLGEHSLARDDTHEKEYEVEKIILQRGMYREDNDIALVKLKEEVEFGDHIRPACLPLASESFPPGTKCTVAGWGRNGYLGERTDKIKHVELPIIGETECRKKFRVLEDLGEERSLGTNFFCAGKTNKDACQFDGGGPMMCQAADGGNWVLTGIVSVGSTCGGPYPTVYTDVTKFLTWIDRNT